MPVTNYYTIDGSIIAEATGGVRTDYLTDALGSVTATVDSSGNLLNTYRYKPYGEQLAKTGVAADPKFTWVGTLGYRQTGRKHSDTYVRARHYGTAQGRWTTKDRITIRPWRGSYYYAESSPVSIVDPTGLFCFLPDLPPPCCEQRIKQLQNPDSHCKKLDGSYGKWKKCDNKNFSDLCKQQGNCTRILESLEFVVKTCQSMCLQSQIPPLPGRSGGYADDDPWDAMQICCEGKPVSCGVWCCDRGQQSSDPCAMECLMQHEKLHGKQCTGDRKPPKTGRIKNYGAWQECDAYRLQALCLLGAAVARNCRVPVALKGKAVDCLKEQQDYVR